MNRARIILGLLVMFGLAGCASVDQRAGFERVGQTAEQRIDKQVVWRSGAEADHKVDQRIQKMLTDELTVDEAVQIALLNNRELQATYAQLGVAQADLVQAGLLSNPIFTGLVQWPDGGGKPLWTLEVSQSFLEIFYIPLRKRVADAEFEAAKRRVTAEVLDLAGRTRAAFNRHQANRQMQGMFQTVVKATGTSAAAAEAIRDAGNIPQLDVDQQRALHQRARLQLRQAELTTQESRERMNTLMGLWGQQVDWRVAGRLPELPEEPMDLADLERRAIESSLDLAAARQDIIAAGEQLGVNKATALVPELSLGAEGEGSSGEWETGPLIEVPLPLFDQGQARIARAQARLREMRQRYYARAVRIRSAVRTARDRLQAARDRVDYYQNRQLPLRQRIVQETQEQYNAMQIGVFELLRALEQQIRTGGRSIGAMRDYWTARAELRQILSGSLPDDGVASNGMQQMNGGGGGDSEGGH